VPGCAYAGLLLHDHILEAHSSAVGNEDDAVVSFAWSAASAEVALRRSTPFPVLLMRETNADAARVFLLFNGMLFNGSDVPSARSLSVVCVGPRPNGNKSLEYKLHVRGAGSLALSA
jgi:E3 ubiquitin-protein ligase SIAH1